MFKRRGFTLIEMLVVLAVLALLAAILVPTISAAHAKSQRSACAANLRQLSAACAMYAADHDALLPPYPSRPEQINVGKQAAYVEQSRILITSLHPYVHISTIWLCPCDATTFDPQEKADGLPVLHLTSYRYSGFRHEKNGAIRPISLTYITSYGRGPARNPLLRDDIARPCDPAFSEYNHGGYTDSNGESSMDCNILFLDGHVQGRTITGFTPPCEAGAAAPEDTGDE